MFKIKETDTVNGTHLQGYVVAKYSELKKLFGQPTDGDGYKVDAEWELSTPFGVATIYNYKDGKNYCGVDGTPKTRIEDWHVGGNTPEVVTAIQIALEAIRQ